MNDYLAKPIDKTALIAILDKYLVSWNRWKVSKKWFWKKTKKKKKKFLFFFDYISLTLYLLISLPLYLYLFISLSLFSKVNYNNIW